MNKTSKDVDEAIQRAAMTGMLNLRDVFELIDNAFCATLVSFRSRKDLAKIIHTHKQAVFIIQIEHTPENLNKTNAGTIAAGLYQVCSLAPRSTVHF